MMDAISTENETTTASADVSGANGQSTPDDPGWPVPEFKYRLSDNPLWPEFLEELRKNREADIAEMNRLADLELEQEKLEQEKLKK